MINVILFQKCIIVLILLLFNGCSALSVFLFNKKMHHFLKKDDPVRIQKKLSQLMTVDPEEYQTFCQSLFFHATRLGSLRTVKHLINRGVALDARSPQHFDQTPLHHALAYAHTKIAFCLVCQGADLGAKDRLGNTPLHVAAHKGLLPIVKLLLKKGAAIDERDEHGYTPLHNAVEQGNVREVQYLLNTGADPNAQTCNGDTPLHMALIGLAHHPKKGVMQGQLLSIIKILGRYPLDFLKREVYNQWTVFDLLNHLDFSEKEQKYLTNLLKELQNKKTAFRNEKA